MSTACLSPLSHLRITLPTGMSKSLTSIVILTWIHLCRPFNFVRMPCLPSTSFSVLSRQVLPQQGHHRLLDRIHPCESSEAGNSVTLPADGVLLSRLGKVVDTPPPQCLTRESHGLHRWTPPGTPTRPSQSRRERNRGHQPLDGTPP